MNNIQYKGIFKPKRVDDLAQEVIEYIGQIIIWDKAWIIEEGTYKGQWAMMPSFQNAVACGGNGIPRISSVPECDIQFIND